MRYSAFGLFLYHLVLFGISMIFKLESTWEITEISWEIFSYHGCFGRQGRLCVLCQCLLLFFVIANFVLANFVILLYEPYHGKTAMSG